MSTPYTHSVAETKGRFYLGNEGSKVCVSEGSICLGFLQMDLMFGFVFGYLYKHRGRTHLKRLALQSGKQRFLLISRSSLEVSSQGRGSTECAHVLGVAVQK